MTPLQLWPDLVHRPPSITFRSRWFQVGVVQKLEQLDEAASE
jgi:hypothetical protein